MLFRQLFDELSCTYTYLLATGIGREAILIDPVYENYPQYIQLAKELKLKLVIAIDTHVHADHVTASGLLQKHNECRIAMGEHSKAEFVDYRFKEGESIAVDHLKIKAIYTPGHTDDSYSFFLDDRLFTGDTLLIRGTGRTDFQQGDPHAQYDSIVNKLFAYPDNTLVYPAHDYKGMLVSTIGEEKRCNPRLSGKSEEEFVHIMNNLELADPKMMDIAVPHNLKCGHEYQAPKA